MDYTTLTRLRNELHGKATADDALLGVMIAAASRAFDRKCTGTPDAVNYFLLEAVTGEKLPGIIQLDGSIVCYPHKPVVTAVTSFTYYQNITQPTYTVDAARIEYAGCKVTAYPNPLQIWQPKKCRVLISYTGGLGDCVDDTAGMTTPASCATGGAYSAPTATTGLPSDLVELVTILAARYYREVEGSLGDTIGVAELSTMVYTKAWPTRVFEQMQPYIRKAGWNFIG